MIITKRAWNPLKQPAAGWLDVISSILDREEWKQPGTLPSLHNAKTLFLFSDYGGEHPGAGYQSLSFLIFAADYLHPWDHYRTQVRTRFLPDKRRMAYKRLAEPCRAKALVPFLLSANQIPGLLLTVLIDHRIPSLYIRDPNENLFDQVGIDTSKWKVCSLEKLSRIAALGTMLIEGFSSGGQDVFWFTDEDQIAPNEEMHRVAVRIVSEFMNRLVSKSMGHFRLGTTKCDDGSMLIEDLAALPDLAAGAMGEVATLAQLEGGFALNFVKPLSSTCSKKAAVILRWLASRSPLRKMVLMLESSGAESYQTRLIHMMPEPHSLITKV